jgi:hypothetical protein
MFVLTSELQLGDIEDESRLLVMSSVIESMW